MIRQPGRRTGFQAANIVDFFVGKGTDANGIPGSPLIFRDIVKDQYLSKWRNGVKVNLHFSDTDKRKVNHLRSMLQQDQINVPSVNITVEHADFATRFKELKPMLADRMSASLLIIDQFGIKQVPVISRMKKAGRLTCDFRVPDIKRFYDPRTLTVIP